MINLLLAMATLVKITSVHNVTMTSDDVMHHWIYNYDYSVVYIDETFKLDETTGEWYRD